VREVKHLSIRIDALNSVLAELVSNSTRKCEKPETHKSSVGDTRIIPIANTKDNLHSTGEASAAVPLTFEMRTEEGFRKLARWIFETCRQPPKFLGASPRLWDWGTS